MDATSSGVMSLYEELYNRLLEDTPQIDYTPRSRAELKAELQAASAPELTQAIKDRQMTTRKNNALVDADAAARGIGTSTWGTDVKNRNMNNEASDISSMRGTYNSNLSSNLMSLLSDQENKQLEVDQYNKSAKSNALQTALEMALGLYDAGGSGSGSGGGRTVTGLAGAFAGRNADDRYFLDSALQKANTSIAKSNIKKSAKSAVNDLNDTWKYANSSGY